MHQGQTQVAGAIGDACVPGAELDDDGVIRFLECAGCGSKEMRHTGQRASGNQQGCDVDLDQLVCTKCGEERWW